MRHIQFIGAWTEVASTNIPAAILLWQANNVQWRDLHDMGQPNVLPDPNVCVWECATVDDAGVTLLEADPANYTILLNEAIAGGLGVLAKTDAAAQADKPKDEKPPTQEKTNIETFLKNKGVKHADAATLCKKADVNATRDDIAKAMIAYCRELPKKK